jgi:hypothetical protein
MFTVFKGGVGVTQPQMRIVTAAISMTARSIFRFM